MAGHRARNCVLSISLSVRKVSCQSASPKGVSYQELLLQPKSGSILAEGTQVDNGNDYGRGKGCLQHPHLYHPDFAKIFRSIMGKIFDLSILSGDFHGIPGIWSGRD